MKGRTIAVPGVLLSVLAVSIVACPPGRMGMRCSGRQTGMMGGGMMSMERHRYVMKNGLDADYADLVNPYSGERPKVYAMGKALYGQNCASCHGPHGRGDGPAAESLKPKPPDIARFSTMPMATDGYLYWTISEGGTPVQSPMPAYKSVLKSKDIWAIIYYIRRMES